MSESLEQMLEKATKTIQEMQIQIAMIQNDLHILKLTEDIKEKYLK